MSKTNAERVLDYLWSVGPSGATNGEIRDATRIQPHQQVYQLTQRLMNDNFIRGEQQDKEWRFWVDDSLSALLSTGRNTSGTAVSGESAMNPGKFELRAQEVMSGKLGAELRPDIIPGVPKKWDLVSKDRKIVGDAKYFTLVQGERLPPAKFSVIAEHIWLLEKTRAPFVFLVFGNDRDVPVFWLKRYGALVSKVTFYFLSDDGRLELLNKSSGM